MDSKHNVEVLQQPLDRVAPEMESVLLQLQPIGARLSALFTSLAVAPEGYTEVRAEVERLLTARAPLIQRLGELAAHVLVLRETRADEGVSKAADATADDSLAAPSTPELENKPPSAPSPPPSPVSQRQLEEFVLAKSTNGSPRAPTAAEDKTILLSLANHVVIAAETPTNLAEEISSLERASDEARVPVWKRMSQSAQVRWIELLVAWAKALEEESRGDEMNEERVRAAFRRLRAFSKYDSPGFIHGFAHTAEPQGTSWRDDAATLLANLRGRPRETTDTPKPTSVVYDELDDDDERDAKVPEDWQYFDRVRGKDVVMLGGEVREERRVALEEAFQMASLTWVPHNRPRLLQSLSERAAQGSVDVILVNKFVAHKETMALSKVSIAPVITMRRGYGITAVRTAIEDWFASQYNAR